MERKASLASSSSTSTTASSKGQHPYLRDPEISAIEHWNASIPTKDQRPHASSNDVDPAVQAYLQAKMALFSRASSVTAPGR